MQQHTMALRSQTNNAHIKLHTCIYVCTQLNQLVSTEGQRQRGSKEIGIHRRHTGEQTFCLIVTRGDYGKGKIGLHSTHWLYVLPEAAVVVGHF